MTSDDITNDGASTHRRRRPRTRRSVLALGAASLSAGVSGCSAIRGDLPGIGSSDSSVFEEISFEGQHMVVQLREGHSVKRVNLIAPNGSEFSNQRVSAGVTRVEFQLMKISPGIGGYEHYSPGTYEFVAKLEGGEQETSSRRISPNLGIVGISSFSSGEEDDARNVVVAVENKGSGPTWIYNIAFENAPNDAANNTGDQPGIPGSYLIKPKDPLATILLPGQNKSYVSSPEPFLFKD